MRSIFDPYFAAAPRPSVAYGKGPYRMRGFACLSDIRRLERVVPGGISAVLASAGDASLTAFFSQTFAPTSFYDVVPFAELGRAAARLRGMSIAQYNKEAARDYADLAMSGFSGALLRSLSFESIALWLPKVSAWFNDFGSVETHRAGAGLVRASRVGLPRFLVLDFSLVIVEFTEVALTRAGARDARVHPLAPELVGTRGDVEEYRVPFEMSWRV